MNPNHTRRARLLWAELTRRTKAEQRTPGSGQVPTTYGELADWLQAQGEMRPHPLALSYPLGKIQQHCEDKQLPRLQSLVVNKKTQVPGGGYHGSTDRRQVKRDQRAAVRFAWKAPNPF